MDIVINMNWIDLSNILQKCIIIKMLHSFGKDFQDEILYNIIRRFTKKYCKVMLYYSNSDLKGVSIYWSRDKFLYLDKFFILTKKNGYGTKMLETFINYYRNENKLIWRTDLLTSKFYLKNSDVIKHFEIGRKINERKVYLGNLNKKFYWEYEDIYDITIKSCFT